MVLAPEKISIKRRRVEEPVDRLIYQSKKQRTSNHIFVRVQHESTKSQDPNVQATIPPQSHLASISPFAGIPVVKSTQPGDEVKDFQKYKASQALRKDGPKVDGIFAHLDATQSTKTRLAVRRFHLTRDLSTAIRPQSSGGIRKNKTKLRPHLPTFIERYQAAKLHDVDFHAEGPIDRVIKSATRGGHDIDPKQIIDNDSEVEKQSVQVFQRPKTTAKTGRSIHDDPATWDLDSDQLANELAALALDMDPDAKEAQLSKPQPVHDETHLRERAGITRTSEIDEFVYETYIRVQQSISAEHDVVSGSKSFGYLVIDEDEEDLWEEYLRDDDEDDDDWDEEDGDSNAEDNPRNDYPDEEVSSDDEYGTNVYKYRRNHSDDEHFDEDDD